MSRLSILLIGDTDRPEFRGAQSCLDRWGVVHRFAHVDATVARLAEGEVVPDVIVVAQAFPGQVSHEMIDRLRRSAPLARIVGLLGTWCEGEMRTGSPWPGVVRTYWHQWEARCSREFGRLAKGGYGPWTLPPTATEEERLLLDAAQRHARATGRLQGGLVVIRAQSHETAEWLSAACRSRGFATVWQRSPTAARVEGALAAIFDGTDLGQNETKELSRLAAALHPAPVVALLAFPRAEDRKRALAAGAATIVSKPLTVDDLFCEKAFTAIC